MKIITRFFCFFLLFISVIIFSTSASAQQKTDQGTDLVVVLHENAMNKLFAALGAIKGSNEYKIGFIDGTYYWTLINPRLELIKDSARFISDVNVKAGLIDYTTQVPGKVSIKYDEKTNMINVKVTDAVFEVYTKILGKKIHIKNIQLADYLTTPFSFEGPMTMETGMDFEMPDGSKKTVYARPVNCKLKIEPKQIVVLSQLGFFDKPKGQK